jgi:hypothetical protein
MRKVKPMTVSPLILLFKKILFRLYSFFCHIFKEFCNRNKKKNLGKNFLLAKTFESFILLFQLPSFLLPSPHFKPYSNSPIYTNSCCQKSERGSGRLL